MKEQDAQDVIEKIEAAIGNWQVYAEESGVSQDSKGMITRSLADVVATR